MNKTLVSIVGPDGCGKTTQSEGLVEDLKSQGIRAAYCKSPAFDWVRDCLNIAGDDTYGADAYTDRVVFAAAHRMEHYLIDGMFHGDVHKRFYNDPGVQRMLEGADLPADVVVCQRGIVDFYSFPMAEGSTAEELTDILKPDLVWNGHRVSNEGLMAPQVIVYIHCDPEICMSRIPREDKWEEVPFLRKLVQKYDEIFECPPSLLKDSHVITINGERPIPEVRDEFREKVLPYVLKHRSD